MGHRFSLNAMVDSFSKIWVQFTFCISRHIWNSAVFLPIFYSKTYHLQLLWENILMIRLCKWKWDGEFNFFQSRMQKMWCLCVHYQFYISKEIDNVCFEIHKSENDWNIKSINRIKGRSKFLTGKLKMCVEYLVNYWKI